MLHSLTGDAIPGTTFDDTFLILMLHSIWCSMHSMIHSWYICSIHCWWYICSPTTLISPTYRSFHSFPRLPPPFGILFIAIPVIIHGVVHSDVTIYLTHSRYIRLIPTLFLTLFYRYIRCWWPIYILTTILPLISDTGLGDTFCSFYDLHSHSFWWPCWLTIPFLFGNFRWYIRWLHCCYFWLLPPFDTDTVIRWFTFTFYILPFYQYWFIPFVDVTIVRSTLLLHSFRSFWWCVTFWWNCSLHSFHFYTTILFYLVIPHFCSITMHFVPLMGTFGVVRVRGDFVLLGTFYHGVYLPIFLHLRYAIVTTTTCIPLLPFLPVTDDKFDTLFRFPILFCSVVLPHCWYTGGLFPYDSVTGNLHLFIWCGCWVVFTLTDYFARIRPTVQYRDTDVICLRLFHILTFPLHGLRYLFPFITIHTHVPTCSVICVILPFNLLFDFHWHHRWFTLHTAFPVWYDDTLLTTFLLGDTWHFTYSLFLTTLLFPVGIHSFVDTIQWCSVPVTFLIHLPLHLHCSHSYKSTIHHSTFLPIFVLFIQFVDLRSWNLVLLTGTNLFHSVYRCLFCSMRFSGGVFLMRYHLLPPAYCWFYYMIYIVLGIDDGDTVHDAFLIPVSFHWLFVDRWWWHSPLHCWWFSMMIPFHRLPIHSIHDLFIPFLIIPFPIPDYHSIRWLMRYVDHSVLFDWYIVRLLIRFDTFHSMIPFIPPWCSSIDSIRWSLPIPFDILFDWYIIRSHTVHSFRSTFLFVTLHLNFDYTARFLHLFTVVPICYVTVRCSVFSVLLVTFWPRCCSLTYVFDFHSVVVTLHSTSYRSFVVILPPFLPLVPCILLICSLIHSTLQCIPTVFLHSRSIYITIYRLRWWICWFTTSVFYTLPFTDTRFRSFHSTFDVVTLCLFDTTTTPFVLFWYIV